MTASGQQGVLAPDGVPSFLTTPFVGYGWPPRFAVFLGDVFFGLSRNAIRELAVPRMPGASACQSMSVAIFALALSSASSASVSKSRERITRRHM